MPDVEKKVDWKEQESNVVSTIKYFMADEVMYHVIEEESAI